MTQIITWLNFQKIITALARDIFIYEDEATPAYPYNFAIVNVGNQKLYASTANPLSAAKDYVMEIDTTTII